MVVRYSQVRNQIKDGDLLSFIVDDENPLHRLTKRVTNSPYYHSGVAVWMSSENGYRRLFICEAQRSGRRLVPMSVYSGHIVDVTPCPVNFSEFEDELLDNVGSVPYGFMEYILIGVRFLFGVTAKNIRGEEVCSEMVEHMYGLGGMEMPEYALAPGELHDRVSAINPDRFRIKI